MLCVILINNKMIQTHFPEITPQHFSFKEIRSKHLSILFSFKEKFTFITRQTLFLAISIYDKYMQKIISQKTKPTNFAKEQIARATTCLWLAWKYLEVNQISLKKLLQKIQINSITFLDVVQMEFDILQEINFQIPADNTYFSLIRQFEVKKSDVQGSDKKNIVSQCLLFLKEAVMMSHDFSLCVELGPNILSLYLQKAMKDRRIKEVYSVIVPRQQQKKRSIKQAC